MLQNYQYKATNQTGARVEGFVEADSQAEAIRTLRARGFTQTQILGAAATAGFAPLTSLTPIPTGPQIIRTKRGTDRDRYFIFGQMASQLRAGVSPAQSCRTLSGQSTVLFQKALADAGAGAEIGKALSDSLECYPDLFPGHVIGLIRAGEQGGFLPQACQAVADQAFDTYTFSRYHWFLYAIPITLIIGPGMVFWCKRFIENMWDVQNKAGGTAPIAETTLSSLTGVLAWPVGPIVLFILGAFFWFLWLWHGEAFKLTRHRVCMKWPLLSRRAKKEGARLLTWSLSGLSKSGIAPFRAWVLAIETVPNIEMRARLAIAGNEMRENTPLAQVMQKVDIFPREYAMMISNGEMTGTLPAALEQISSDSASEFTTATSQAKAINRHASFGCIAAITGGLLAAILYWWLVILPNKIVNDVVGPDSEEANPINLR